MANRRLLNALNLAIVAYEDLAKVYAQAGYKRQAARTAARVKKLRAQMAWVRANMKESRKS